MILIKEKKNKIKIKCFKCKGKGYIRDIDYFTGIMTFGITLLTDMSDKIECDCCKGKGWIENED